MRRAEGGPDPAAARAGSARMLGALRHRNYRLFLTGQIISTIGTWMQSVAMPWLALQLTHSGLLVGLVLAVQFTPVLLGSQFGGIVADRYRKRSVLLTTQAAFTIPSFALFLLSSSGHAMYWEVLIAAAATGTINAFDVPARQSFVIEMVGKQDLMNAIALNSSVFNGAAVVGPSVAGVIIGAAGVPVCFLANSVSYLAAVAALLLMRNLPAVVREKHEQRWRQRLAEGAAYVVREPMVGMYHSHFDAQVQVPNGLLGAFYAGHMPLPGGTPTPTVDMPLVLNDAGTIGFSLNGKSFPAHWWEP